MKKNSFTLLVIVLAISILTACSSQGSSSGGSDDDTSKKMKITMVAKSQQEGGWDKDHPLIKYLDDKFNIDLHIRWVPSGTNEYKRTLNTLAASQSLPDVFLVDEPVEYLKWQQQGAFVDLTPYMKDYPDLANEFTEDMMNLYNPSGKLYGLPQYTLKYSTATWVRKDWLDKLGLEIPGPDDWTLDEFYKIAKAFTTQDPNGNGKKDELGFTHIFGTSMGLGKSRSAQFESGYGIPYEWAEKDGKLEAMATAKEGWKGMLTYLNKAYEEGVLDPDFANNTSSKMDELAEGNKLGMITVGPGAIKKLEEKLKKVDPDAEFEMIPYPPKGPNGERGYLEAPRGRAKHVINSKASDEKIKRILDIFNWWITDEGKRVMKDGPEGVTWEKNSDGKVVLTDKGEELKDSINLLNNYFFRGNDITYGTHGWEEEQDERFNQDHFQKALSEWDGWTDEGADAEIQSETFQDRSKDLAGHFNEGIANIIAGKKPVSSMDDVIKRWREDGGDQMIKEVNEAYKKNKQGE